MLGWADVRVRDDSIHKFDWFECHARCNPTQSCVQTGSVLDAGGGSIQDCRISANKLNGILVADGADPALSGNNIQQNGASGMSLKVQCIAATYLLIIRTHGVERTGSHMTHQLCCYRGVQGGMRVTAWLAMAEVPSRLTSLQM